MGCTLDETRRIPGVVKVIQVLSSSLAFNSRLQKYMFFFKKLKNLLKFILMENNIRPLGLYSKKSLGILDRDSIWEQVDIFMT